MRGVRKVGVEGREFVAIVLFIYTFLSSKFVISTLLVFVFFYMGLALSFSYPTQSSTVSLPMLCMVEGLYVVKVTCWMSLKACSL